MNFMTFTTKSSQPSLSVCCKQLLACLWIGVCLFFCTSCDQNSIIGRGIINKSEASLIETDTFTVEASTILADSVRTDRGVTDYLLAGQYQDPTFGKITATSFFRIVPGSNPVKIPDDTSVDSQTIDSLVLVLGLQKFAGDPLTVYPNKDVTQTLLIHRLTEEVTNSIKYYSFNEIAYDPTPLASVTFNVAKLKEDKFLRVNLTQLAPAFSTEIINLVKDGVTTSEVFQTILKGFALVPPPNSNNNVIAFANDNSTALVVHYTKTKVLENGAIPDRRTPAVINLFPGISFHGVKADRTGTPLATAMPWTPLLAKNMNGNAYMQACLGFYTRLTFPTLKNLKKLGNVLINKTILHIKPVLNSTEGYAVPANLFFYESGANSKFAYQTINNERREKLISLDGTNNPFVGYDTRDEEYEVYLSRHCHALMSGDKTNEGIIVVPANNSFTVNRAVLSNTLTNTPNKIKLRVFYTIFK